MSHGAWEETKRHFESESPSLCLRPPLWCVYTIIMFTRAHHTDEIPERDVTYHLTCLLIYH